MKKIFIAIFFLISAKAFASVPDSLGVLKSEGKNFIRYKVESGDGWYGIAHRYGISLAELRMANKDGDGKLSPGQIILIPSEKIKANDPYYSKNKIEGKPVKSKTHKVVASETLYSISKSNDVSVDQLKQWNHLTSNSISVGQELIVSDSHSIPEKINVPEKPKVAEVEKKNIEKKEPEIVPENKIKPEEKKVVEPEIKKEENHVEQSSEVKNEEEPKPVATTVEHPKDENISAKDSDEKKFSFGNGRQEVNETGIASWIEDEEINPNKYYALHRTAPLGTIIKITNRMNNKSIFVKVVGKLPDTGDNEGLIIKISKASADKLNVLDRRFQADLIYGISQK